MTQNKTKKLVECGLLFAMSVILSFIHLPSLPYGGSVTLCSMLPIVLISYRYGVPWGLFSGFVFSILQMAMGVSALRAYTPLMMIGVILFDYLLAFTVLGLGGIFRNRFKNPTAALALGSALALFLRFIMHFISGFIFFGEYAEWFFTQDGISGFGAKVLDTFSGPALYALYSSIYNATYMIPEIIIPVIVAVILSRVPEIQKKF